jgi:hypothetical protein
VPNARKEGNMQYRKYIHAGLLIIVSLFIITSVSMAGGLVPKLPDGWSQISPDPSFTWHDMSPSCSSCPGLPNTPYTFFVRKGTVDKVLIYFNGGGACWDSMNCIEWPYVYAVLKTIDPNTKVSSALTYNPYITESVSSGQLYDGATPDNTGIFDFTNPKNPFKDWYVVYLPYCTGDLFWGAKDNAYPDTVGYFGGVPQTIHHRGFVNFQAVLKWVRDNFKAPLHVFVTGSSAGGYGAMMNYPFIRKAFPLTRVDMLSDAAMGITQDPYDPLNNFNAIANNVWNVQYPTWIFPDGVLDLTSEDLYMNIAAEYPLSKLAEYTAAYDSTQSWFYHLQLDNNVENPYSWYDYTGTFSGYGVGIYDASGIWNIIMNQFVHDIAATSPNYRYYMAKGTVHTILKRPEFYTESSAGGVYFYQWLTSMVNNPFGVFGGPLQGIWQNLENDNPQ